jgi:hypothetical protein
MQPSYYADACNWSVVLWVFLMVKIGRYGVQLYETLRLAEMDGFKFYDAPRGEDYYLVVRQKDRLARPNATRFEFAHSKKTTQ